MRFSTFIFVLTAFFTSSVSAKDNLDVFAQQQSEHVLGIFKAVDHSLQKAIGILGTHDPAHEKDAHDQLRQIVGNTQGVRAIIYINKEGILSVDSFTYPARQINLGDRTYVKASMTTKNNDIYIGTPVTGRNSGVSFIPLSKPVFDKDGQNNGVVTAIITPESLILQDQLCTYCFMAVLHEDGTKMVSYPSTTVYEAGFLPSIKQHKDKAPFTHQFGQEKVESIYKVDKEYGLHLVISQLVAK